MELYALLTVVPRATLMKTIPVRYVHQIVINARILLSAYLAILLSIMQISAFLANKIVIIAISLAAFILSLDFI